MSLNVRLTKEIRHFDCSTWLRLDKIRYLARTPVWILFAFRVDTFSCFWRFSSRVGLARDLRRTILSSFTTILPATFIWRCLCIGSFYMRKFLPWKFFVNSLICLIIVRQPQCNVQWIWYFIKLDWKFNRTRIAANSLANTYR